MQAGIERFKEMRIHTNLAACQGWLARSELSGGDPSTALAGLLEVDRELETIGERSFRSTTQATIALVYERLGDTGRARAAVRLAEELAAPVDDFTLAVSSVAHARLTRSDEDLDEAERWARKAVGHAYRTDMTFLQGIAQLELAQVLAAVGGEEEAHSAARAALDVFLAKGDQPRAREALAFLGQLDAVGSASQQSHSLQLTSDHD
jgi:ATP/maltotriose-dependent transcriptional regulator MalT